MFFVHLHLVNWADIFQGRSEDWYLSIGNKNSSYHAYFLFWFFEPIFNYDWKMGMATTDYTWPMLLGVYVVHPPLIPDDPLSPLFAPYFILVPQTLPFFLYFLHFAPSFDVYQTMVKKPACGYWQYPKIYSFSPKFLVCWSHT